MRSVSSWRSFSAWRWWASLSIERSNRNASSRRSSFYWTALAARSAVAMPSLAAAFRAFQICSTDSLSRRIVPRRWPQEGECASEQPFDPCLRHVGGAAAWAAVVERVFCRCGPSTSCRSSRARRTRTEQTRGAGSPDAPVVVARSEARGSTRSPGPGRFGRSVRTARRQSPPSSRRVGGRARRRRRWGYQSAWIFRFTTLSK